MKVGDYVAAKTSTRELFILARVSKKWNACTTYKQTAGLTEVKRDALFKEKVFIQDNEDFTGDVDSARAVSRQHILPLPRSFGEATEWATRIRKGTRLYAMYPSTTALYACTAIDSTSWCRNQDDIVVVEFDGDEDDDGTVPQRHIPARFLTLIPREMKSSQNKKKRRKSTNASSTMPMLPSASSLPSSKPAPLAQAKQKNNSVDEMLFGMLGDSTLDRNDNTFEFSLTPNGTPGSTPPPATKKASKQKKQKTVNEELASSHF